MPGGGRSFRVDRLTCPAPTGMRFTPREVPGGVPPYSRPAPGGTAAGAGGAGPADHRPSGGTPLDGEAAAGGVTAGEMAGHATVAAPSGLVVGPAFGMTTYAHSGGDGT